MNENQAAIPPNVRSSQAPGQSNSRNLYGCTIRAANFSSNSEVSIPALIVTLAVRDGWDVHVSHWCLIAINATGALLAVVWNSAQRGAWVWLR